MASLLVHRSSGSSTVTLPPPAQPPAAVPPEHQVLTFPSELEVFPSSSESSSRSVTLTEDVNLKYRIALAALNDLAEIVIKHQWMRDELSNDLRLAGEDLTLKGFELLSAASLTRSEIPREAIFSHLIGLKKILSFGQNMLQQPSILLKGSEEERAVGKGFVAEEAALETYCNAFNVVAQQLGRPERYIFEQDVSPHPFARDMLQWMRNLAFPELQEQEEPSTLQWQVWPDLSVKVGLLGVFRIQGLTKSEEPITAYTRVISIESMDKELALRVYSKFDEIIADTEFRLSIKMKSAGVKEEVAQTEQRVAKNIADYKASVEQWTKDITGRWVKIEATHEATVKRCEEATQKVANELGETTKVVVQLQGQVQIQAGEISGLKASNQDLKAQVQGLDNRVRNMRRGCIIL